MWPARELGRGQPLDSLRGCVGRLRECLVVFVRTEVRSRPRGWRQNGLEHKPAGARTHHRGWAQPGPDSERTQSAQRITNSTGGFADSWRVRAGVGQGTTSRHVLRPLGWAAVGTDATCSRGGPEPSADGHSVTLDVNFTTWPRLMTTTADSRRGAGLQLCMARSFLHCALCICFPSSIGLRALRLRQLPLRRHRPEIRADRLELLVRHLSVGRRHCL